MALIGNGAQSEFQAIAFHHMVGIREVRLFDTDAAGDGQADPQSRVAAASPDFRVMRCASIAEAVRGADIVTTVTADKRNATILTPDMIEPGMHLNAVGGDCPGKTELHAGHSAAAGCAHRGRVRAAGPHRGGDSATRRRGGAVTELADVVRGRKPGRLGSAKSRFSIRWASRSTISRRCATCIA